jgi:hypothetical protein
MMFVGISVHRVSYVSSLKTCHFSYEDGTWLLHMLMVLVVWATADRVLGYKLIVINYPISILFPFSKLGL